ncbi:hypothetical protein J0J21_23355 [Vibrio vulnificus]|nr:hypothetical protein [Vibrio vulnificus]
MKPSNILLDENGHTKVIFSFILIVWFDLLTYCQL